MYDIPTIIAWLQGIMKKTCETQQYIIDGIDENTEFFEEIISKLDEIITDTTSILIQLESLDDKVDTLIENDTTIIDKLNELLILVDICCDSESGKCKKKCVEKGKIYCKDSTEPNCLGKYVSNCVKTECKEGN